MTQWTLVAALDDCPPDGGAEFVVDGRIIAVFRVADDVFALDGICPHQGGPIGKGALDGCVVTCPWHGWQYDVRDGQHTSIPALQQPTIPVKVEGDSVYVSFDDE